MSKLQIYASKQVRKYLCKNGDEVWLTTLGSQEVDTSLFESISSTNLICDVIHILEASLRHFALVLKKPDVTYLIVDRVRSYPLYFRTTDAVTTIYFSGAEELRKIDVSRTDAESLAEVSIELAGYSISDQTIVPGLNNLSAGHYAVLTDRAQTVCYSKYYTKSVRSENEVADLEENLRRLTLAIIHRLIERTNGRWIVVPLSAGHDSRLIVSGLWKLGYLKVKCFSYGTSGNFEAQCAARIASKLGYEYRFVPINKRIETTFLKLPDFEKFVSFADGYSGIPYIQGLSATQYLLSDGWITRDDILVNGNSGDFISGGHIPSLRSLHHETDSRLPSWVIPQLLKKHFSLWESNDTRPQKIKILGQIEQWFGSYFDEDETFDQENEHLAFECFELMHRQAGYVIQGQRIYDFYNLDWALPLWDPEYIDFWKSVPISLKIDQTLYKRMLRNSNWGGVWGSDFSVNKKYITPTWIIPVRFLIKCVFGIFGKKGRSWWKTFEITFLHPFTDITQINWLIPYGERIKYFRKRPRSIIAFIAMRYLSRRLW